LGTRLPDLLVSSISVPSSSVAGGGVTVTDTVISLGVTSAVASTNYYYLSTKPYYDVSAISLGSRSVGALAVGATDSGSASVTIPVGTAVGNYYIIAKADGADLIRELYETNNTRSGAIKIGVADLTVSTVTVSSTISGAGSLLGVGDTTQNIGSGTAVASTTKYYLSKNGVYDAGDVYLGERTVPSLAGGASDTSGTTVTIPIGTVSGNWNIVAVADAGNVVVETYKTNNSSFRAIKIGPDLTVSAVTAPATAAKGSSITVGDTTQNSGIGSAGASTTRYYLSTNGTAARAVATLANRAVPSLGAGVTSTTTTSVTIPLSTVPGKYYIVVEADTAGAVPEIYETNNTMFRQITIQ
jgi:subtilase family serine protease